MEIKGRLCKKNKPECSIPLTCLCECIPTARNAHCCLFFPPFLLFSQETGREREWGGDWINYVLSAFSWLKSTLLPLDSLCLCLRQRQMDRAYHPVQALPFLLSETWTFRSVCWGCVVSLGFGSFCVVLSSFLSVIHLPSKMSPKPAFHYMHYDLWE